MEKDGMGNKTTSTAGTEFSMTQILPTTMVSLGKTRGAKEIENEEGSQVEGTNSTEKASRSPNKGKDETNPTGWMNLDAVQQKAKLLDRQASLELDDTRKKQLNILVNKYNYQDKRIIIDKDIDKAHTNAEKETKRRIVKYKTSR